MSSLEHSRGNRTLVLLFISLVIDLLAFTVILPLLPSILDHFEQDNEVGCMNKFFIDKLGCHFIVNIVFKVLLVTIDLLSISMSR